MRKLGGVVIRMQQNFDNDILEEIDYLLGNAETIKSMPNVPTKILFDSELCDFLNTVSKKLMSESIARKYPDIITFAFWIRKSSILALKKRFEKNDGNLHLGRGIVFHIAPSNVPVNFAYSLVAGLLTGNANIVRVSTKEFSQVEIIISVLEDVLKQYETIRPYICLIRYEREKKFNDFLSGISDIRVVWGGNGTIAELRKSDLLPGSTEITFADRYSIAVINADVYVSLENKEKVAVDFYNDTYLTDQNACTSPRLVVWTGDKKQEAKDIFWEELYKLVKKEYSIQAIQGMNKLTSSYLLAAQKPGIKIRIYGDNRLLRVTIPELSDDLMDWIDNSGYFFEYDCKNVLELKTICDNKRCQTISYIGRKEKLFPLLQSGVRGDRKSVV